MAKWIMFQGTKYIPVLTRSGKLDVRAMVAYGEKGKEQFMLTVYCMARKAASRAKNPPNYDVQLNRDIVPNWTSEAEQLAKLTFALDIWATRLECDYKLRLPIETKPQPKYSRKEK